MSAGQLRDRINIKRKAAGQDAIGQPVTSWELVASVWADIRHQSGLSAIKGGADVSTVKASIRIRHRAGLDAGMRVVHGATIYDIKAVLPDDARQYVDLVCEVIQ